MSLNEQTQVNSWFSILCVCLCGAVYEDVILGEKDSCLCVTLN